MQLDPEITEALKETGQYLIQSDLDTMEGIIDVGEYGQAKFKAKRHQYGQPGGVVRPIKNV